MFSPMGSFMTELYPTAVRGTGQGFCYNAGRGIGALFPALVGFLATRLGLGPAIAVFSLTAYGIMIVACCCFRRHADARSRAWSNPRGTSTAFPWNNSYHAGSVIL